MVLSLVVLDESIVVIVVVVVDMSMWLLLGSWCGFYERSVHWVTTVWVATQVPNLYLPKVALLDIHPFCLVINLLNLAICPSLTLLSQDSLTLCISEWQSWRTSLS